METNVVIQHAPEKWAAGEALYEQPEKVAYIYGCQKKGRESRAVARLLVKPSKSYDKELESYVGRDVELVGSKVMGHKVRDDLSINCRNTPDHIFQGGEGRAQHPLSAYAGLVKPGRSGYSESSFDVTDNYSSTHKYKSKQKSAELSHKPQHRNPLDFQEIDSRYDDFRCQKILNPHNSKKRPIPVEFHLTEDQLPIKEPTVHLKRPINLPSPCSLASSLSREKPSPLVILEIKDGPTFFYKPSEHMLSDVGMGDEMAMPMRGCASNAQAAAGCACPDTARSYSRDLSKTSSTSAYKGSLPFSNWGNSPYSPLNRDSSTGLPSVGHVTISTAGPSLGETSKFRSIVSNLPRTPGLRKPDLSVLSSSHKSRAHSYDDDTPLWDVRTSQKQVSSLVTEPGPPIASMPVSSTYTVLPSIETLPEITHEAPISKSQTGHNMHPSDLKQASAFPDVDLAACNKSQDLGVSLPTVEAALDVSCGFQNISEILQQQAGIKHDDIVVGPRRPASGAYQDDLNQAQDHAFTSGKLDFGHGLDTRQPTNKPGLSLSTYGLSICHPIILLKAENNRGKHTHSESEASDVEISTGDSQSKYRNLKSNLNKGGHRDSSTSSLGKSHDVSVDERPAGAPLSKLSVAVNAFDAPENWRQPEKVEVQRFQPGKIMSGHNSDLRSLVENLALSSETIAPYSTKSLDRNLKHFAEMKHLSKFTNTSPAKQQQLHSPMCKSSLPTPIKKNPVGSKLHMLSNIPGPICHDSPVKRDSRQRPPATQEHRDTTVPSVFEKDPVPASSKSSSGNLFPKLELIDILHLPSASNVRYVLSDHSFRAEPVDGCTEDNTVTEIRSDEHLKTPNVAPTPQLTTVLEDGNVKQPTDVVVDSSDTSASIAVVSSETSTSVTAVCSIQTTLQSSPNAQTHVPVKPRLHRSAEHLLGAAKLTVFNSAENVPHFEQSESSSSRTFHDSPKLETAESDSISPLKKNHSLAKIGIMRRGSDRTEMYRKGSERSILPINQNDPSVEDLKKATSLKELCQSMACLLNIDNVKAAEMITTSLSQRQDLVEGLDADAILDYLSHHGVLDPGILVGLDDKSSITQRNSAILRHVEEHGNTAVALFINALRQSGQLHLASSLDTEQRIQPVSGSGYFGKDRHKGELSIKIEIESLKIIAPREPRSEKIVDTSLLGMPGRQTPDDSSVVVKDASEEEDFVKPRSCWCFCFSYKSKIKSMSKKDAEKQRKNEAQKQGHRNQSSSPEKAFKSVEEQSKDINSKPHRTKSQGKTKKMKENSAKTTVTESSKKDIGKNKDKELNKKSKASKSKSKVSGKHSIKNSADASQTSANQTESVKYVSRDHGAPKMTLGLTPYIVQQSQTSQRQPYVGEPFTSQGPRSEKESWDPIIMEYDPKLELIKLRAGQEELASPTRQSGNIGIMCEQWKSNGRHFQQKASMLCARIVQVVQTEIIKYFEQDRGTLVLDVVSGISSIFVINICMKRAQVKRLQQEIADKSLLTKMEDMFFSRVNIMDFDIRGVNLRIVLDEQELNTVLSELS